MKFEQNSMPMIPLTHIPQMQRVKHLKTDLYEIQITSPKYGANVLSTIAFGEKEENLQHTFQICNSENWKEAYQETTRMQSIASFEDGSVSH
jgi:hypothetical protein